MTIRKISRTAVRVAGISLLLCLFAGMAFGTAIWTQRFNGTYNSTDYPYDIAVDASGNSYVGGMTYESTTNVYDYCTIKYDTNGNQLWVSKYNGTASSTDYVYGIAVHSSGDVYVTGISSGSGSSYDITTVKYNSSGAQQWVARYNGAGNSSDYGYDIAVDSAGNSYVTGYVYTSTTGYDVATIKYDTNGNQQWVSTYNNAYNGSDYGRAIAVDSSGNVYVAGYCQVTGGYTDILAIKYNSSGTQQWVGLYNGPYATYDYGYDMKIDSSGNMYVSGHGYGSSANYDVEVVKWNTSGTQVWSQTYNGLGNGFDYCYAIALDSSNNVYAISYSLGTGTSYDYATLKYDTNGNQLWASRYDGGISNSDYGYDVDVDNSGNVYSFGYSYKSTGYYDYTLVKYNSAGSQLWVDSYNGTGNSYDYGRYCMVDKVSGDIYVTGYSTGSGTGYDWATQKYSGIASSNNPPVARAGGPYNTQCNGRPTTVNLNGSGSYDPDNDPMTYAWTTTCTGGSFNNSTIASPILSLTGPPPCPRTCNVTLTVRDSKGATGSETAGVTVPDTTVPNLVGVPVNQTVECDVVPTPPTVTATDVCDATPTVAFTETRTNGACQDRYTLTRTWTATDDCNNVRTSSQTVTVQDTKPPVLTGVPANQFVECDSVPIPASPTAKDNCDTAPTIRFGEQRIDGPCPYTYDLVRTWTATDRCTNANPQSQNVGVQDTTPPQVVASFDPLLGYTPDPITRLYTVHFQGQDNCEANPTVQGYLDGGWGGETCDETTPGFIGYPVSDGDVAFLKRDHKLQKCRTSVADEPGEPVVSIHGPALVLKAQAEDSCNNPAATEDKQIVLDPNHCITSMTVKNNLTGVEKDFFWFDMPRNRQPFDVGGELGYFDSRCNHCVLPGATSGNLTVTCVEGGKKLARVCRVPESTLKAKCYR